MDTDALKPILAGMVRHLLTTAGGALVAGGYIQSSDEAAFIGGGMVLAGIIWSWWQKRGQAKVLAIIAKMHPVAAPSATTAQAVKAATDAAKAVASILLIAFALSCFLGTGSAHAQTRRPAINLDPLGLVKPKASAPAAAATADPLAGLSMEDIGKKLQAVAKDVVDKGISDLTAASTDAQNRKDQISQPCWDSQIAFLKLLPVEWQTPPTEIGPALAIQISRDLVNSVTGNDPGSLKVSCAALLGDQLNIVNQVLAVVGVQAIGLPVGL